MGPLRVVRPPRIPAVAARFAPLAWLLCACAGCAATDSDIQSRPARGLVYVIPGIEGGTWSVAPAARALRDAGVQSEIRVHDWWQPVPLNNLVDYARNRRRAAEIAAELSAFRAADAAAPIDVLGYSGGGGLAIFVLEALPKDVHVRNAVLVQPAISPDYDLTAALDHTDGVIANLYSPLDLVILGAGTRLFGTMDRKNVASAGQAGFDVTRAVPDPSRRDRIVQQAWTIEAAASGHLGDHVGCLSYDWNRRHVAPLLVPPDTPRDARR